mmetsp:Transcript_10327/g.17120  ORF Transcript_10327/g.17120 Transcript_10327/m.17120 type:complete len:214 (+) Transcript_10327:3-644(+)
MYHLARHLHSRDNFLQTVKLTLKMHMELTRFLASFGAEASPDEMQAVTDFSTGSGKLPEFWHLEEPLVIEMFTMCAQAFRHSPIFSEHPANKDQALPEDIYDKYCRPQRVMPEDLRSLLQAEVDGSDRRRRRYIMHKPNTTRPTNTIKKAETTKSIKMSSSQADVDEVMDRFTPRLREIIQETAEEYRANSENENFVEETRSPGAPPLGRGTQ